MEKGTDLRIAATEPLQGHGYFFIRLPISAHADHNRAQAMIFNLTARSGPLFGFIGAAASFFKLRLETLVFGFKVGNTLAESIPLFLFLRKRFHSVFEQLKILTRFFNMVI